MRDPSYHGFYLAHISYTYRSYSPFALISKKMTQMNLTKRKVPGLEECPQANKSFPENCWVGRREDRQKKRALESWREIQTA